MDYNGEAQSTGMGGGNANVGMEGIVHTILANGSIETHWHGFLGDGKQQDVRTSYSNTKRLIVKLRKLGYLTGPHSVLYIQSDGCGKQYKCATGLAICSMLATEFNLRINWMVTCAHHGKCLVDALAGRDKHDICNALISGMDDAMIDEHGDKIGEAQKACNCLMNPKRINGLDGDTKHKRHEGQTYICSRCYEVTNYDETDNKLPLKGTTYVVVSGFYEGKKADGDEKYNGIMDHFHFYFDPFLPDLTAAVRRIPCNCRACHYTLSKGWEICNDWKTKPELQPKFNRNKQCVFEPMLGDLNDWRFVKVAATKAKFVLEEVCAACEDALESLEAAAEESIRFEGFGAVGSDEAIDGISLVQWTGKAYTIQGDSLKVVGCKHPMPEGTVVAPGRPLKRIEYAPLWYEIQRTSPSRLYLVRHILEPELDVMSCKPGSFEPGNLAKGAYNERMAQFWVKKVPRPNWRMLLLLKQSRAKMNAQAIQLQVMQPVEAEVEAEVEDPALEVPPAPANQVAVAPVIPQVPPAAVAGTPTRRPTRQRPRANYKEVEEEEDVLEENRRQTPSRPVVKRRKQHRSKRFG
jgi:hypothetical protein